MEEHAAALRALLYLPVVLVAGALAIELAARAGSGFAIGLRSALRTAPPAAGLAALLMAISALIHLALVPAHMAEDPVTAALFLLDGGALAILAAAVVAVRQPGIALASAGLLAAGVAAYLFYLLAGLEPADPVGVMTKAVELAGIGLLLRPILLRRFATP